MDQVLKQALELVSKRNPGALRVCFELLDYLSELAVIDFNACVEQKIQGSDLYDLYAHCCERDISKVHASLMQGTAAQLLQSVKGSSFYKPSPQEEK